MANKKVREWLVCENIIIQFYGCENCKGRIWRNGYPMIKVKNTWAKEYKVVMENYLGHKLKKSEVIHHIDHDINNNNIENLIRCDSTDHHYVDRLLKGILNNLKPVNYIISKDRRIIFDK